MVRQGSIDSDMVSEHRELKGRPQEELGFYLVASNRELLNHVETLMNRKGVFGVLDSSGRVHYLIDARKGSPLAARNVMATAGSVAGKVCRDARREKRRIRLVVDQVLGRYEWNKQLRGYRLLGDILRRTATDISLLNPISKRLYPEIAKEQGLRPHQVERNVRYLFDDLAERERSACPGPPHRLLREEDRGLPVGRTITRLAEEVWNRLDFFELEEIDDIE
ncbi:MAG TPA: sporulation initiation factor Spo0A C-terminal domain-containing protein [Bacillota bacterium]|jgi:hypothetical protein|nr:hypothetical protein [Fastidiosipila sp.]HPX92991.1 sporulation initiation factor Spo0A C-terminal domain-containing protein [Bacillota bacterium]HQB80805.1 sporulation initiation factor Spo0A C-terminal domain-containing protein [Bacillota bacterium]